MPDFYKGKKLKVREAYPKKENKESYLEVTIPAILRGNVVEVGDMLTPYFDGVIVYAPEGVKVDTEKLREAIIKEVDEKEKREEAI